jgi:hypothetical protein
MIFCQMSWRDAARRRSYLWLHAWEISHLVGFERPDQAMANLPPMRSRTACSTGRPASQAAPMTDRGLCEQLPAGASLQKQSRLIPTLPAGGLSVRIAGLAGCGVLGLFGASAPLLSR